MDHIYIIPFCAKHVPFRSFYSFDNFAMGCTCNRSNLVACLLEITKYMYLQSTLKVALLGVKFLLICEKKKSDSSSALLFTMDRKHPGELNPLSAKFIKWSNTLKQIVCLSVFDHFSGLAFKGLNMFLSLLQSASTNFYLVKITFKI